MNVPIFDLGFRYGKGVFETVRVVKGTPQFFTSHFYNICEGASALGLKEPFEEEFDFDFKGDENGIWRWFVTDTGVYTLWEDEEKAKPFPEEYRLSLSNIRICSQAWESRYKTLSYLFRLQAREEGKTDEVVLLNEKEQVASAAMANLFWVKGEKIFTPHCEVGCRKGVARTWVLNNFGKQVEEVKQGKEGLEEADEIFLTNSRIGIMPVSSWEGKSVGGGEMTHQIKLAYDKIKH